MLNGIELLLLPVSIKYAIFVFFCLLVVPSFLMITNFMLCKLVNLIFTLCVCIHPLLSHGLFHVQLYFCCFDLYLSVSVCFCILPFSVLLFHILHMLCKIMNIVGVSGLSHFICTWTFLGCHFLMR